MKKTNGKIDSPELLLEVYRRMLRIRRFEEAIADRYPEQRMRCPVHLSIGQELAPVGLSVFLTDADRVYSSHRCHAHYLAKLGDPSRMIAELHGKTNGCAKGKGGSMHLVDVARGMMGSSALVAGSVPLAVGAALGFRMDGEREVAVAYLGDGGSEEGVFYECLNLAALKRLPVIFACENNRYATYSPQSARQATDTIFRRGESFGIEGRRVDGYDLDAVLEACRDGVASARRGEPVLLEFLTCRWRDHVGPSDDFAVGYRTAEDVEEWKSRCPLAMLRKRLLSAVDTAGRVPTIDAEIEKELEAAFAFADAGDLPVPEDMFKDIYA